MTDWNDVFIYSDGLLIWKKDKIDSKGRLTRVRAGDIAGTIRPDGYVGIVHEYKRHLLHRIIWEMHNGAIPEGMTIDHIDHNPANSKIENLRMVEHKDNLKNQSMSKANKSGFTGVFFAKNRNKWRAVVTVNYKKIVLGHFDNFEDAVSARKTADKTFNFHENHGA